MIRFMVQKLLHKKWMVICLLIGNIMLIAIASSNPMYQNAALQKTLSSKYAEFVEEENAYPGTISVQATMRSKNTEQGAQFKAMYEKSKTLADELGVEQKELVEFYSLNKSRAQSLMGREDNFRSKTMSICSLSNMKNHVTMLAGSMYTNKKTSNGALEAVVSQRALTKLNLVLGEEIEFANILDGSGKPYRVLIKGVFENKDKSDPYWVKSPAEYYLECFIDDEVFRSNFVNYEKPFISMSGQWTMLYDYTQITPSQVNGLVASTSALVSANQLKNASIEEPGYYKVLKDYQIDAKKIATTLMILQIPVLALLLAFIFMISRQMLDLEQNEIAMLKSRGASKYQIIMIYTLQSGIISLISFLAGLPLGFLLCSALGSTNGFLEFIQRKALHITLSFDVFLYCLGAMLISIAFMVLPVIRDAEVTIVNYKQKKNRRGKTLIQRAYIDVILLAVSLYGLYSFTDRKDALMAQMLKGSALDPFLFLCSSIFIISASLVALRIQPLLIRLVFIIGKKHWKPAFFASFLQILRTKGKQSFMMVFLMLTVALGIFNATVARTILSNSEQGIRYATGADLILKQPWEDNQIYREDNPDLELTYYEPDFGIYQNMKGVAHATKVYKESNISLVVDGGTVNSTIMGVDTKSFGETIKLQEDLLPTHINNYLNAISKNPSAVILSMNYHDKYNIQVGDAITLSNEDDKEFSAVVYGFVEYWPGYVEKSHVLNDEGVLSQKDNYLIIGNLSKVQAVFGLKPYEVWIDTKDDSRFIYDYAKKNNIEYTEFKDVDSMLVDVRNNALFQGTNGILTMSFIVILILCCTGFLIYWILSIRQRELLFGVFRAMGMTKKEIIQMLINEQIFSSGVSIGVGTILGIVSSTLFVPLVQIFYASTEQAVPLVVVQQAMDMIRLFSVIGLVIVVCMIVLGMLISKIRISQALKLGED